MKTVQPGRIEPQTTQLAESGHESSDIFLPGLIAFLVLVAFGAFVIHAGLWGWLKTLRGKPGIDAAQSFRFRLAAENSGVPLLQVNPSIDLDLYRRDQNNLLNNYSWVDRKAGVVRIPIEKAIDAIVSNGLPKWGGDRAISPLELQRSRAGGGAK